MMILKYCGEKTQLGIDSPDAIIQTLWLYFTIHFGMRSVQEHRDMCWGDVQLKTDNSEVQYLIFSERQTKTRSGDNTRNVRAVTPKLYANTANSKRCPIEVYKMYASKRPLNYCADESPFYIACSTVLKPRPCELWFKRNHIGINKLAGLMRRMVTNAGLNSCKKLSNHSARKYLVQKLNDCQVPANQIMQISGHKNIASVNNYSHINENQHKQISNVLYNPPSESTSIVPASSHVVSTSSANMNTESNIHVTGGSFQNIFGAPIHGGTFHVHIHQEQTTSNPRKRILPDTDSE